MKFINFFFFILFKIINLVWKKTAKKIFVKFFSSKKQKYNKYSKIKMLQFQNSNDYKKLKTIYNSPISKVQLIMMSQDDGSSENKDPNQK